MFEIIDNYNNSLNLEEFNKFVSFVCKKLKLDNCYFNIIFVDDEYIRKINIEYRGIDNSTDVISFALEDSKDLIETNERMLGDIYISYDKAKEQADYFNHTTNDEIIFNYTWYFTFTGV